jgi:hypothetical protein
LLAFKRNAARKQAPRAPGPLLPGVRASCDVVKKIVPWGTGWVTGLTALIKTIAQKYSKIKNYESVTDPPLSSP